MRYISFLIGVVIVIATVQPAYCGWEEMIIVNIDTAGLQAPRDGDCPWPIASDANGNIYTVWEDKRDTTLADSLHIYFRKKNRDGSWDQSDEKISKITFAQGQDFTMPPGYEIVARDGNRVEVKDLETGFVTPYLLNWDSGETEIPIISETQDEFPQQWYYLETLATLPWFVYVVTGDLNNSGYQKFTADTRPKPIWIP